MTKQLTRLASRIFGTPLLIDQKKLDVILRVLAPRLGLRPGGEGATLTIQTDEMPMGHTQVQRDGSLALISVVGPLVKRDSGDALSGGPTTYAEIRDVFRGAIGDPTVKGVIFDIDSPGGEVNGLFSLCEEIFKARGQKPIYAVCGDAFSAAFAIASACERVYVEESGGIGSVGVIACHCDQSGFDEKLGVSYEYIFAGAKKKDMNLHEPLSDSARADLQAEIDRLYTKFINVVARNREVTAAAVRATEAGLFFGDHAVVNGFADQVGGLDEAVSDMTQAVSTAQTVRSRSTAASETPIPIDEVKVMEPKATAPAVDDKAAALDIKETGQIKEPEQRQAASLERVLQLCTDAGMADRAIEMFKKAMTDAELSSHIIGELKAAQVGAAPIKSALGPVAGTGIGRLDKQAEALVGNDHRSHAQIFRDLLVQNPQAYGEYIEQTGAQRATPK